MRASRVQKRTSDPSSGALSAANNPCQNLSSEDMDGDEAAIGSAQNIGLCKSRPVARGGCRTEREIRGKGFDRKMRHCLEHRYLDETTLTGPAALNQRAEHAVRGIKSGDRIGKRRTQKARTVRIDDNAEESTQGLSDRIVARALRVRTTRSETADGRVYQPRIDR